MTVLHSIIFGLVEGITEFLPISSTGHLILTAQLLGLTETDFLKSFEIIIQLGAILAVVILYWKQFWNWPLLKKLAVAFLPTGLIGLACYHLVKTFLLGNTTVVLWALFLGGIAIIWFEKYHQEKTELTTSIADLTYRQAFLVGLFQSVAIIPGVSRSAATILGGLWLGLKRETIVEFSFLLAVPTMLAATSLDLLKNYQLFSLNQVYVLVLGFGVALVTAILAIKFLLQFIRRHNFIVFGYYRLILTLIFWLVLL